MSVIFELDATTGPAPDASKSFRGPLRDRPSDRYGHQVIDAVHPEVSDLVADLHARLVALMNNNLVGLYVFGSVAAAAYDPGVSDVDLLVVTAQPLAAAEYARLREMHAELTAEREQWTDRVEVEYLSPEALRTFKERASDIGVIGPGKPFQVVKAGREWMVEWYDVREHGIVVAGPDPKTLIDPITLAEVNACIADYVLLFPGPVRDDCHRGSDAYAVLTMCRALHTKLTGETTTKRAAAEWAASEYPQWHDLIIQAQRWRLAADNEAINGAEIHAQVEAFVNFTIHTLH